MQFDCCVGCLPVASLQAELDVQPFYSTENITRLVKVAETRVRELDGEGAFA